MCQVCEAVDYGFDLSDRRGVFHVYDEEGDITRTLTITIRRVWFDCPCGEGSDFRCEFDLTDTERIGGAIPFPGEGEAEAYIGIVCPEAERNEGWIAEDTGMQCW